MDLRKELGVVSLVWTIPEYTDTSFLPTTQLNLFNAKGGKWQLWLKKNTWEELASSTTPSLTFISQSREDINYTVAAALNQTLTTYSYCYTVHVVELLNY